VTGIFRKIDDFMFDHVFQPIVNRFPDAGPVGVARFLITGDLLAVAAEAFFRGGPYTFWDGVWDALVFVATVFCYVTASSGQTRHGCRNHRRVRASDFFNRICILLLATIALALDLITQRLSAEDLASYGDWCLFTGYLYAVACDKLPPKRVTRPSLLSRLAPIKTA
jgi:hypothetical protein